MKQKTRKPKKLNKKQSLELQALIAEIKGRCHTVDEHLDNIRKFKTLQKVGKKRKAANNHIQRNKAAHNSIIAMSIFLCIAMNIIRKEKRLAKRYSDLELLVKLELQKEVGEKNETAEK